jgi:glycosyltransferase involved in cell wall biosynthesis
MTEPTVSVIIPSYNSRSTIAACLGSLREQRCPTPFEVIVVDGSDDGTADLVAGRFPEVQLHTSLQRKLPGDARNFGVSKAQGEILAFTDADCVADPRWLAEIIHAHRDPDPAIGGTIDNGNPRSYVGWAAYLSRLSRWMPQRSRRRMTEVPTGCLSLKRWAFERYGPFLERTYSEDTALSWKLSRAGLPPVLNPSIKVSHINRTDLGDFLGHQVEHGRYFARVRACEEGFSRARSIAFVLLSPLLPLLLFSRTARRVVGNGRYVRQLVLGSPLIFLGHVAWSIGECVGYAAASTSVGRVGVRASTARRGPAGASSARGRLGRA